MHVKIVYTESGRGLLKDCELLQEVFETLGHRVTLSPESPSQQLHLQIASKWYKLLNRLLPRPLRERALSVQRLLWLSLNDSGQYDLTIHLQSIHPRHLGRGNSWLIPNQEWFSPDQLHYLNEIDTVVCKTREAERIFSTYHSDVHFTGFSSPLAPSVRPLVKKDSLKALHVAGNSPFKGTDILISIWSKHPEWPQLTVISNRHSPKSLPENIEVRGNVSHKELTELWEIAAIAILPSEVEGYGQVLIEAQIYGCVVITTDGPPMNEVVSRSAGVLAPYSRTRPLRLGTRYFVDSTSLEQSIHDTLDCSPTALKDIAHKATENAQKIHSDFVSRISDLISQHESRCEKGLPGD